MDLIINIDGKQLVQLMIDHNVGVSLKPMSETKSEYFMKRWTVMTINQLSEMRENGLRALIENGWLEGFKRLFTDLYPDNVHFIYEFLQNAEDAGASK